MSRRIATPNPATAYHEAGHAVAAWLFGYGCVIKRVSAVAEEDFLGVLEGGSPLADMDPEWDSAPEVVAALENDAVILNSGPVAQRRFKPRSWREYHGSKDRSDAVSLVGKLGGSIEHEEALHARLYQRAEALISAHWAEVEAVAAALIECGELSGNELIDLLEAASGRHIPRSELFDYRDPAQTNPFSDVGENVS